MVMFLYKEETVSLVEQLEASEQPPEPHDYWERLLDLLEEQHEPVTVAPYPASHACP